MDRVNFLSIDLEDWYTSGRLRSAYSRIKEAPRLQETIPIILDLFDKYETKATFFTLGSIAEKHPKLVSEIDKRGHELASHSYHHVPLWNLSKLDVKKDFKRTNCLLEDITGKKVLGFRAPFASLNQDISWVIDILEELDFKYDSSIFPMKTPLYGSGKAPLDRYIISSKNIYEHDTNGKIIEVPFTVESLVGLKIPCTGGIYGRFLPYPFLKYLLSKVEKNREINFYFHPWEIDKALPKVEVSSVNKLFYRYNVSSYFERIKSLLSTFKFTSFKNKLNL